MSLESLRILSANQDLQLPIDNNPSTSSSDFNTQKLSLNNGSYQINYFEYDIDIEHLNIIF